MADQAEKFNVDPSVVWSQCVYCKHIAPAGSLNVAAACKAFPSAIPAEILANKADHRKPIEGDEGMGEPGEHVLFEPREDVPEAILANLYKTLDQID